MESTSNPPEQPHPDEPGVDDAESTPTDEPLPGESPEPEQPPPGGDDGVEDPAEGGDEAPTG